MDAWSREIDPTLLRRMYPSGGVGCVIASRQIGWPQLSADAATKKHLHAVGVFDLMGITAPDPNGCGVGIVAFYSEPKTVAKRTLEMWGRIGVHLSAAFRLRRGASSSEPHADAVLDPSGKLLHAETPAKGAAARERLRDAARSIDQARSAKGRLDSENAVATWRGLVAGKWTLVDRFESDGRRLLVARRNDPDAVPRSDLTPREAQIAGYAALGQSSKLIAYSLGLSQSAVSESLGAVFSKLGISSRAELIGLFAEAASAQREQGS
jgi:DNA-binding CsgD family transcriptional regulator